MTSLGDADPGTASLALDASGHPVVAYQDSTGTLAVLHCGNPTCTSGNVIARVDSLSSGEPSLALDSSGNPVVSYGRPSRVAMLHCATSLCSLAKPPETRTPSPTPSKQSEPGNTDGAGCSDERENGSDETLGGLRDYLNPNDVYDVLGPGAALPTDGIIDLPNDILGVIQHFSPQGAPPYDVQFDRGPSTGPNPWNMTAPDGVIDLPNDILGVILQFGHSCA